MNMLTLHPCAQHTLATAATWANTYGAWGGGVCSARPPDRLLEWPLVILDIRPAAGLLAGFLCAVSIATGST